VKDKSKTKTISGTEKVSLNSGPSKWRRDRLGLSDHSSYLLVNPANTNINIQHHLIQ